MELLNLNVIKILFGIIFIGLLGCDDAKNQNTDTYKIVTILVDRETKPIVPPPPPGLSDSLFQVKADSILDIVETESWQNQKFIVGLDTLMTPVESKITDSIIGYRDLLEKLNGLKDTQQLKIKNIGKTRGVELTPVPVDSSGRPDYSSIDMRISFSCIVYNKDGSKAMLVMGVSRGRLNGYASLLILEKVGNEWQIVKEKVLSIS